MNQKEVLSEQTHGREILLRHVSESNKTPFKKVRYNNYKEEWKAEMILRTQPCKISPINLQKTALDFKKRASLDSIIEALEYEKKSRFNKTLYEK